MNNFKVEEGNKHFKTALIPKNSSVQHVAIIFNTHALRGYHFNNPACLSKMVYFIPLVNCVGIKIKNL